MTRCVAVWSVVALSWTGPETLYCGCGGLNRLMIRDRCTLTSTYVRVRAHGREVCSTRPDLVYFISLVATRMSPRADLVPAGESGRRHPGEVTLLGAPDDGYGPSSPPVPPIPLGIRDLFTNQPPCPSIGTSRAPCGWQPCVRARVVPAQRFAGRLSLSPSSAWANERSTLAPCMPHLL